MKNNLNDCPCGSMVLFAMCCEPFIKGQKHCATAEQLMRARYTAFVIEDDNFIKMTWLGQTAPDNMQHQKERPRWIGLTVENSSRGEPGDDRGEVCFCASYLLSNHLCRLREKSRFVKRDGRWYYLDGQSEVTTELINSNSKCPCGSGKKFKRCCG